MSTFTVGTIKEIKDNENRIGLTPQGVAELSRIGVRVLVEKSAGAGSGFSDQEYQEAGAEIVDTPEELVKQVDVLVKVKEPLSEEYHLLELMSGKLLYTFLHLSGVPKSLTDKLLEYNITAIAYETIKDENDHLPCLAPMSEIAGVIAIQYGAEFLQIKHKGRGKTLSYITNADMPRTVIVGGGVVGTKAAMTAAGMGGKVTLFEINPQRIEELKHELSLYLGEHLYENVEILQPEQRRYEEMIKDCDVLVGAVLITGKKCPEVVSEELVRGMKSGSVVVDVAIDQGGCIWGSKATTHSEPTYMIDDKIFCCVANMPGQAARQSTQALTKATLPYLVEMCEKGILQAALDDPGLAEGFNTVCGHLTYKTVAEDWDMMDKYLPIQEMLKKSAKDFSSCPVLA